MSLQNTIKRPSVNILVLASGKLDSKNADKDFPLCLTEIDGVSVLERIVNNSASIADSQYAFTFLETEAVRFHLVKAAKLLVPCARCTLVPELSQGSACTALLAACQLDQAAELLIISANELVDIKLAELIEDFRHRMLDAGTLTFRSIHPRYSYVRLNDECFVIEATQCEPISFFATAGIFWFAKTAYFVEGAKNLIRKDAHVNGSYFVAPIFNELVLKQKKVGIKELDITKYFPLKTEQQIDQIQVSHLL
jgi:hypothetical protein